MKHNIYILLIVAMNLSMISCIKEEPKDSAEFSTFIQQQNISAVNNGSKLIELELGEDQIYMNLQSNTYTIVDKDGIEACIISLDIAPTLDETVNATICVNGKECKFANLKVVVENKHFVYLWNEEAKQGLILPPTIL